MGDVRDTRHDESLTDQLYARIATLETALRKLRSEALAVAVWHSDTSVLKLRAALRAAQEALGDE